MAVPNLKRQTACLEKLGPFTGLILFSDNTCGEIVPLILLQPTLGAI